MINFKDQRFIQREIDRCVTLAEDVDYGRDWQGQEKEFCDKIENLTRVCSSYTGAVGNNELEDRGYQRKIQEIYKLYVPRGNVRFARAMVDWINSPSPTFSRAAQGMFLLIVNDIRSICTQGGLNGQFLGTAKALEAIRTVYDRAPTFCDFSDYAALGHALFDIVGTAPMQSGTVYGSLLGLLGAILADTQSTFEGTNISLASLILRPNIYNGYRVPSLMIFAKKIALTFDGFGEVIKFFMHALAPNRQYGQLLAKQLAKRTVITKEAQKLLDDKSSARRDDRMALLADLGDSTPLHVLCKFGTSADELSAFRSGWFLKGFIEAFGCFFNFTKNGALRGALTVADPNKFGPILTVCGGELWERPRLAKLLAAFGIPFLGEATTVTPLRMAFLETPISPIDQSMEHMAQFVMLGMSSLESSLLGVITSTNAFHVSGFHLLRHVRDKSSGALKEQIHGTIRSLGSRYMREKQKEFFVALDLNGDPDEKKRRIADEMQPFLDKLADQERIGFALIYRSRAWYNLGQWVKNLFRAEPEFQPILSDINAFVCAIEEMMPAGEELQ